MKPLAHSIKDIHLVGLTALELILLVYGAVSYGQLSSLTTVGLGALLIFLICTNFQCAAHNFIHNPFFTSRLLNQAFSIVNSCALGIPQSLYRIHHLNHHKYNNDPKDMTTGITKDWSSTFRYARKPGEEESIMSYALLGFWRGDFGTLLREAKRKGLLRLVILETVALGVFVASLGAMNWKGSFCFFLPVWYLGHCSAHLENYLEHHGATPGNRLTDSVSCYNSLYNLIWFNNGYHQEHHYKPQVHWTKIPEVTGLLPPVSERRVVRGAHWFNFNTRLR